MPSSSDREEEAALDACIDRLLQGDDWHEALPADAEERGEIASLMAVASRLLDFARGIPGPHAGRKAKVRRRAARGAGQNRALAYLGDAVWNRFATMVWRRPAAQRLSPAPT